jgi:hypothetical protein
MYIGLHVRYLVIIVRLNFDRFSKYIQISVFMKIHSVGAELFHVDRQADMTKLIVSLGNLRMHLKTSQVMLYKDIIYMCSGIHMKHISINCG